MYYIFYFICYILYRTQWVKIALINPHPSLKQKKCVAVPILGGKVARFKELEHGQPHLLLARLLAEDCPFGCVNTRGGAKPEDFSCSFFKDIVSDFCDK